MIKLYKKILKRILWGLSVTSFLSVIYSPVHAMGVGDFEDQVGHLSLKKISGQAVAASYDPNKSLDFLSRINELYTLISPIMREMQPDDRGTLFQILGIMNHEERAQYTPFIHSMLQEMMKEGGIDLNLFQMESPPLGWRVMGKTKFLGNDSHDFTAFLNSESPSTLRNWGGVFSIGVNIEQWFLPKAPHILLKDLPVTHLKVMSDSNVDYDHLASFFQSGWNSLVALDFSLVKSLKGGARAIAESQALKKLQELNLQGNEIDDEGVIAIAESKFLQNLRVLNLKSTVFGAIGVRAISKNQFFANLRELDLSYCRIGCVGLRAIAESKFLQKLEVLNLAGNYIYTDGARAIAGSEILINLQKLDLMLNYIGVDGARAIAESQVLRNLQVLGLGANNLGDAGAEAIAGSKTLRNLAALNLGSNNIGLALQSLLEESELFKNTKIIFF